ncbi:tyrosine-type recombinase/integrase [Brachybacterium sp. GPGPB12]|uniref:tyrosine-type recombinase/integrase n=1 Tax=Brachybacterium sp. GPGPB12 TaxID=3023517 RepID=UPI003134565C
MRHPDGRYYHLHECRHATATILMALGVDTQVIIAIMGHASILSTRRYQHADLEMMRRALEGVASRLQLTA